MAEKYMDFGLYLWYNAEKLMSGFPCVCVVWAMQNQHSIKLCRRKLRASDAGSMLLVKLKGDANACSDHLTLRLVRLKRSEAWPNQGEGFSFVLTKAGSGRYASPTAQQNLLPGDVLVLNSTEGGKIEVASDR